ncbi:TraR/DksA family transcriptional regulator [Aeromonas simiae]|uniref:Molecular chaperone DnaK n=1 Tax=Aeromonas simiae TaxID=218936 RepID=A0A5J6X1H0_9GAMM|nr:TraR/DksA C4-type zinc finger protein [Aeromonas simiae]MDO2949262.1 TraR/DksA C4-type zinc finger protein [Aeromonas simiae]MDO2952726.1 TraR/DksA C4-type zinc finger protein [Aeromonas simiae]MDO2956489.1 TraR/DksA C4-type zinc finger protein [Aeromonas simiae]QFI56444.1 molecular chaperone DnaK [Aeromonas simiae]
MCDVMTEDQLAFYKGQIQAQIDNIEERLNSQASQAIATDTNEMADEIDRASVEEARRLELNRIEHDKLHLRKLKAALKRIDEGDFGYCESCGDEIAEKRLQARPESRFCVECQSTKEFNDNHVYRRVA